MRPALSSLKPELHKIHQALHANLTPKIGRRILLQEADIERVIYQGKEDVSRE